MPNLSRERTGALVRAMAGRRIVVVGDVMLDHFLWGDVTRISPEAPVPVVRVCRLGSGSSMRGRYHETSGRSMTGASS